MIEKPKRPKKIPNQDNKQPQTIEQLIRRYDLDNTKIYDFLDELVETSNKKDTYSTNEQIIGTWIDGKPIYRKVITFTPTEVAGSQNYGVSNVENIISLQGFMYYNSDNILPLNFSFEQGSTVYYSLFRASAQKGVIKYDMSSLYVNKAVSVIIEYTKTTD